MTKGKKRGKGAMCPTNPKMCLLVALNAQIGIIQVMKQSHYGITETTVYNTFPPYLSLLPQTTE